MDSTAYDVVIIGAGSAGLSAALVLGRSRRTVLVLDGGPPRNAPAAHVNGYLGVDGLSPLELLEVGRAQVEKVGVEVREARATRVAIDGTGFVVEVDGRGIGARRVVLATGVSDELPAIPGLAEGFGHDVLHCPYCHGYEVADRRLGVLATTPMATHQATMLRQWSSEVTYFLNDTVELSEEERSRFGARGVRLVDGPVLAVERVDGALSGVRVGDVVHELDAIFTGPTMHLNLEAVAELDLTMTETPLGDIVQADPMGQTSVPGLFAPGNISNAGSQVVIAAAAGSMTGAMVNMSLIEDDWAAAVV